MAEELVGKAKIVVQGQEGDSLQAHHDDLKPEAAAAASQQEPHQQIELGKCTRAS